MYIRTKDEILKALDTDYMCGVKVYHTEKGMITEKLALKQTDTIEELIDEYVVVGYDTSYPIQSIYDPNKYIKDVAINYKVYGAIWTDKGLQYIAKMNSKGELELL